MPAKKIKLLGTPDDAAVIANAAARLREGQIVILPTETVYGAAAILTNPQATARLKALRGSNETPLALHIPSAQSAARYVGDVGEFGNRLMQKLWPGPVGMIFQVNPATRAAITADLGLAESDLYHNGSITLRCPDHPATLELLNQVDRPTVAIGFTGPLAKWTEKVDLILDAGPTRYTHPSTLIKVERDTYRIVREGVYDERIIQKMLKTNILFICSGNTCRSPMAEALGRKVAAEKLKVSPEALLDKGYAISSAGVVASPGSHAAPPAIIAIEQLGGDLSKHRSRTLSPELLHQADAIFVMGQNHRRAVSAMAPSAAPRVHLLDPAGDIEDPIGGDVSLYLSLARRLTTLITDQFAALKLF